MHGLATPVRAALALLLVTTGCEQTRLLEQLDRAVVRASSDDSVRLATLSLAGDDRRALIAPAESHVRFRDLSLRRGAVLRFAIGLDENTWQRDGDGVLFSIRLDIGRRRVFLFSRLVDPAHRDEDRRWLDFSIPLGPHLPGDGDEQTASLVFRTQVGPRHDANFDTGAWSDVRITYPWFAPRPERVGPNVLLLSLDTLRADHIGAYGYERATTPNLDALAEDAIVFEHAIAPANHTLESHMSLMTGLYPAAHGVRRKPGDRLRADPLSPRRVTLAETLQAHGYATGGFAYNCVWMQARYGFGQGFDHYRAIPVNAQRVNDEWIFPWLEAHRQRTFFLFVHYYDVHSDWRKLPYDAPKEFVERFAGPAPAGFEACRDEVCATKLLMSLDKSNEEIPAEHLDYLRHLYDAGVAATDEQVGRLIGKIRKLGLYDDTVIVVTADHGEEFREHGNLLHKQLYEETIRVPLIVRHPATLGRPRRIAQPTATLGIMPTILDVLGISPIVPTQATSLPALADAAPASEGIVVSGLNQHALLRWPWKLIEKGRQRELYNLHDDPGEVRDLADQERDIRTSMVSRLRKWKKIDAARLPSSTKSAAAALNPSEAERERLRALGYAD